MKFIDWLDVIQGPVVQILIHLDPKVTVTIEVKRSKSCFCE